MTHTSAAKRPLCSICLRPQRACICRWITPTAHTVEVMILQHPMEIHHAKGSARLLHLSLPHSRLVTGEAFDERLLHTLLHAPFDEQHDTHTRESTRQAILLYPDTPDTESLHMPKPPPLDAALLREPAQLRLIVLDATWRKSRKMMYLNPLLQSLPRLALCHVAPSQYTIRKAHRPEQLSTLEATCQALMQLEGNDERYRPLLEAFDGFVGQQMGYWAK